MGIKSTPEYEAAIRAGDAAAVSALLDAGHPPRFEWVTDPDLVDLILDAGADPTESHFYGSKPLDYFNPPCLRRLIARGLDRDTPRMGGNTAVAELLFDARDRGLLFDIAAAVDRERLLADTRVHWCVAALDDGRVMTVAYELLLVEWVRDGDHFMPSRWVDFDHQLIAVEQDRSDPNQLVVTAGSTGALIIGADDLVLRRIEYPLPEQRPGAKTVSMPDGTLHVGTRSETDLGRVRDAAWHDEAGLVVLRWTDRLMDDSYEYEVVAGPSPDQLQRVWVDPVPDGLSPEIWWITAGQSGGLEVSADGQWAIVQLDRYNNSEYGGAIFTFVSLTGNRAEAPSYRLRVKQDEPRQRYWCPKIMTASHEGIWLIDGSDLVEHRHDGETYRAPAPERPLELVGIDNGLLALTETGIHHWQPHT